MNTWGQENYQMGIPPMMPPSILPPPMMMQEMNVPPMKPPPIPLDIMSTTTEDMNIVTEEMSDTNNTCHDASSNEKQNRRSRSRDRSQRRDKDRTDRRHRSGSRDGYDRYNRNDKRNVERSDRNRNVERERKTKWDNNRGPKNNVQQIHTGINMGMNMGMIPGMNMISFQNMLPNMIGQQSLDGTMMPQHLMPNIMMANMMPNMLDQNMMMMNQQNMMPIPNQQIYLKNGVMLPPIPGTVTPERRERPKGCRTIFVGGLPLSITNETLMEMFQKFGSIEEIKSPKSGVHYIRFEKPESVAPSFFLTGYRFKFHDQHENEATTIFVDYALNREDQNEYDRKQRHREKSPPRVEPFSQTALTNLSEKIKSETEFATAAPTLAVWLERGECSKRHANAFYSLIQASNNQIRRLFTEKMQLDDDFQNMKNAIKEKFAHVVMQFDQVAKILSAAKHQRVSDHFTKQQRRNIEMWLKMTEEVENIKEEFNALFDEDESERPGKNSVTLEKYEQLKQENENLTYELEGYKNEAYLAKGEAERKFEKFKAHFIAQQALQNKQAYPYPNQFKTDLPSKPTAPTTIEEEKVTSSGSSIMSSEAKLISILTAFLLVHPLGASTDYLVSYVKSMTPDVTQTQITTILQKFPEIFHCETSGVGACIEHRWIYVTFDKIKNEK